ncbi:tripartite tricarboxylate transporter TctB family protein [Paracoccus tibetensis]|uniref:Tripartite tricarboxylate transporter TctB family protein n=1 Tax=Paracoccus tibetensis TaxID=336292 RepID=A0A1G5JHN8_9RHOB|nr:tripartite tricarboxylate transporter TctB family protein [Paracoccus tibetensis]SCY87882.1 Tripartite tricarboxylate transporter TctB family protein [Paracoccus tibetensis]
MDVSRDAVTGMVLMLAGIAMFVGAQGFSPAAGLQFGAGFFPKIVSCGMAFSGMLILLGALRQSQPDRLTMDWRGLGRIGLLVALIAGYALALDPLGYHLSTIALLFTVALFFGASWWASSILAVSATLILHFVFYSVMRVSLPWGVLLPYSW